MDYKKLGFKCGIEIHNRLSTQHKLFCNCSPSFGTEVKKVIERKLRVVPGEMGNVDPAALHEFLKKRTFLYQVYDNSCLVEQDDEPPHDLNREALDIVLQVAMMLKSDIPDEIHVMRKTVIDGSNTSGFQRTAIVGRGGEIKTSKGSVRITNVNVEEDSAGIVERKDGTILYRLDRLGIPLVEIGTAPDIIDPDHAQEAAEKLGMLVRSTGKSQRGIGSIRQDVNVSIAQGARIEIKGVQELGLVKDVIEKEVLRQMFLVKLKEELLSRRASVGKIEDVTDIFKDARNKIISNDIRNGKRIYAAKLSGFFGYMKREMYEGKYFAKELTDYAKAFGAGGFFHNEEDLNAIHLAEEFAKLKEELGAGDKDVIIVLSGNLTALEAVLARCAQSMVGVPEETRQANPDGSTSFMRPMPGSSRLYPETDVRPIKLDNKILAKLKKNLPETWEQKEARYVKKGLPQDLAHLILRSPYLDLFEELSTKHDMVMVARTLTSMMRELKRENLDTSVLTEDHFKDLFDAISKGKTAKESVPEILRYLSQTPTSVDEAIGKLGLSPLSKQDLHKIIRDVFRKNPVLVTEKKSQHLMGLVMKEVRGRVDGRTVMEAVNKELGV